MAINTDREFLGRDGTEQLVATVKTLLSGKQDKDSYIMTDRTTGAKYCLYVDNGKLMMSEVIE